MRILHVVHTPRYSGAEILVTGLTKAHAEMGHQSQVVSFNPIEEDFLPVIKEQESIGVAWNSPKHKPSKLGRLIFIANEKCKFKPDVIFAHSVIPAVYARLISPTKVITVLHAENNYSSKYFTYIENFLQWVTKGVIAVSETARLSYEHAFPHPLTKNIPNGIDVRKFNMNFEVRKSVRDALGIPDESAMILQVGRIDRIKQQHLSILAAFGAIKANPSTHLYFLGLIEDATYWGEMQELIRENCLERNIHFLGARSDIAEMLCAADLFLMPSAMEAQGIALIEALASGVPIIASNIQNFQFATAFEGVTLLSPNDTEHVLVAIQSHISGGRRYERDLSDMSIEKTATEYIRFSNVCFSSKQ